MPNTAITSLSSLHRPLVESPLSQAPLSIPPLMVCFTYSCKSFTLMNLVQSWASGMCGQCTLRPISAVLGRNGLLIISGSVKPSPFSRSPHSQALLAHCCFQISKCCQCCVIHLLSGFPFPQSPGFCISYSQCSPSW